MKTGGHIKRCNVGSIEDHNERRQGYLDRLEAAGHPLHYFPELTKNNQHWVNEDKHYKGKTAAQIFELQQLWYFKLKHQKPQLKDREYTDKNGRTKVKAGWSPLREAVIVIKPDTKLSDFDPVLAWFRSKGVTPFRLDIHLDEGHVSKKTDKRHINYHAHLGLDWMNWKTGSTVKLGKKDMSELQTILAKALGMERGILKEITGAEHIDQEDYRAVAQAEENREIAEENLRLKEERDALTSDIDRKRKTVADLDAKIKHAKSSVWQRLASIMGADKLIESLRNTIKRQEDKIKALQAKRQADADNYKAALKKARTVSEKPFNDFLVRIGTRLGITPSSARNNFTESNIMSKLNEHLSHESDCSRRMREAEDKLKHIEAVEEIIQIKRK